MCLILLSYENHPCFRLIFAANRDEFFNRPASPMAFWETSPDILAGTDLKCGGTWLGITRTGRFAAITNYRDPSSLISDAPSRGFLVSDFLAGAQSPLAYLQSLQSKGQGYNGFNLIAGDRGGLFCYSNRSEAIQEIPPGVHGLSNRLLNTPWPKVVRGKEKLAHLMKADSVPDAEAVFRVLKDRTRPPDHLLPETGVGLEWERLLSPLHIGTRDYGTRCATVILWDNSGKIDVRERTFSPGTDNPGIDETRCFGIQL